MKMTVANVVMFEFDTPEELEGWAQQYGKWGPFPNNIISLFVKTGDTSAIGINTYPDEEATAAADQHRVNFIQNQRESFNVREVMPLSGPILVEFINGVLTNNTEKD